MEDVSAQNALTGRAPRAYQEEMFRASLEQNTIVAMDTGTGKTYVAILRIQHALKHSSPEQFAWFLAPKRALCEQQHEVLRRSLPGFEALYLSGEDGVDKWKHQRLWDAALKNVRIVVSTPQVLLDALDHGFVRLPRLAILVLDEAHCAVKDNPARIIMNRLLDHEAPAGLSCPLVLGLTASPVRKADEKSLRDIERNLGAVTRTPRIYRAELEKVANRPFPRAKYFLPFLPCPDPRRLVDQLMMVYENYDFDSDPYVIGRVKAGDVGAITKAHTSGKTYCAKQLKAFSSRAKALQEELGFAASEWFVKTCIERWEHSARRRPDLVFDQVVSDEKCHLARLFSSIIRNHNLHPTRDLRLGSSNKMQRLFELLGGADASTFTGLIFVKTRAVAHALTHAIQADPTIGSKFRVAEFVGASTVHDSRSDVFELVDCKRQRNTLEDFRLGRLNLVVCTDVLEEGIDVPSCNHVICFDPPTSLVSFIQRRGRARQEKAHYYIFLKEEVDQKYWEELEKRMIAFYMDEDRLVHEETVLEDQDEDDRGIQFKVKSTGATLTLTNSVPHLHHFCNGLGGQFLDAKPTFTVEELGTTEIPLFTASVLLPAAVHPDLRHARSQHTWKTKKMAQREAAFNVYIALYRAELLNDHLLPIIQEPETDRDDQSQEAQTGVRTADQLTSPWRDLSRLRASSLRWHGYRAHLNDGGGVRHSSLMLWIPSDRSLSNSARLYYDGNCTRVCEIENSGLIAEGSSLKVLRQAMSVLLYAAFSNNDDPETCPYAVLITPDCSIEELPIWISTKAGVEDVRRAIQSDASPRSNALRLVRDSSKFMAQRVCFLHNPKTGKELIDEGVKIDRWATVSWATDQFFVGRKYRKASARLVETSRAKASPPVAIPIDSCILLRLPASYATSMLAMPPMIYLQESTLIAEELRSTVLKSLHVADVGLVQTAITASSAQQPTNYQRLEFLGDCILKLLVSFHLMAENERDPEAFLTKKKMRMISNPKLCSIALSLGLDRFIITKAFTGAKWKPPMMSDGGERKTRKISSKVLADVVESLIGALYCDGFKILGGRLEKGVDKVLAFLKMCFPETDWRTAKEMTDQISVSATRASKNDRPLPDGDQVEALLGYTFHKKQLMCTALTHSSCLSSASGMTYERLEFLGDAILDYIVTTRLFEYGKSASTRDGVAPLPHSKLHTLRECLVNRDILAFLCMQLRTSVTRQQVIKTGAFDFEARTFSAKQHLYHKIQRDVGAMEMSHAIEIATALHERHAPAIKTTLASGGKYPWPELLMIGAPKYVSDIIESCVAAMWIDSDGDLANVESFLERLGVMPLMRRLVGDAVECVHPKERLGVLAHGEEVKYCITKSYGDQASGTIAENDDGASNTNNRVLDDDQSRGDTVAVLVAGVEVARLVASSSDGRMSKPVLEARAADLAVKGWDGSGGGAEVVQRARQQRENYERSNEMDVDEGSESE